MLFVLLWLAVPALSEAASGSRVPMCRWEFNSCEVDDATVLAGIGATPGGFELAYAKEAAYTFLCAAGRQNTCEEGGKCAWSGAQCYSLAFTMVDQRVDLNACSGTKGGGFVRCVFSSLVGLGARQCDQGCGAFRYATTGGDSTKAVCVPTWALGGGMPSAGINERVASVLRLWDGVTDPKYTSDWYGCCPAYISNLLRTAAGCGGANSSAACGRGAYGTFCEWNAEFGGGVCQPSKFKVLKYGNDSDLTAAAKRCRRQSTEDACVRAGKVTLPTQAVMWSVIGTPPPQQPCKRYWDMVRAWASQPE